MKFGYFFSELKPLNECGYMELMPLTPVLRSRMRYLDCRRDHRTIRHSTLTSTSDARRLLFRQDSSCYGQALALITALAGPIHEGQQENSPPLISGRESWNRIDQFANGISFRVP